MLKKGQTIEMASNSPFVTGCDYNSHLLLVEGYSLYRKKILDNVNETSTDDSWHIPKFQTRAGLTTEKPDTRILPHVLISRVLKDKNLIENNHDISLKFFANADLQDIKLKKTPSSVISYEITSIEISITEFGCGYAVISGTIEALDNVSFPLIRDFSKILCPIMGDISPIIVETINLMNKACPQDLRMDQTILGALPGITSEKTTVRTIEIAQEIGRIKMGPRIFTIPCETTKEFKSINKICRQLLISDSEDYVPNSSLASDDLTIYTGNGSSVTVYKNNAVTETMKNALSNTHPIMNFFYFMTEKLTSNLFFLNNTLNLVKKKSDSDFLPSTTELENRTDAVIEYKAQVDYFLARYKGYDNDLDPQSLRIWRDIEELWEVNDRFDALEDQLKTTDSIYTRLHNNLNSVYNKRIGTFLMFFTLLSMLSVIVDTVDFTQGDGLVMPSILRMIVLVGMAVLFLFLGYMIARRK